MLSESPVLRVLEPFTITLPQDASVARVTFEAPDHLDVWLEDASHLLVYAPIGGHIHIEYHPCQLKVKNNAD